jgi:hypothetical protein
MTRTPASARTTRTGTRTRANGKRRAPRSRKPDPDLGLEVMTITAELAQEWLDGGGTNRKISPAAASRP